MLGSFCEWSDCPKSTDCKRFMIVNKELDTPINFKAICPNHPIRPYYWQIEMDKDVVVKEESQETEKDVTSNEETKKPRQDAEEV